MQKYSRRGLLSTAAAGTAALSGCSSMFDRSGTSPERGTDTPQPELNTEATVQATAVAREGDNRGRVTVNVLVENPNDSRVEFSPNIRIGDTDVTGLRPVSAGDGTDDMRVAPDQQRRFQATETVSADDHAVTLDGEEVTTVALHPDDTTYMEGNPGRTGPTLPNNGIGVEPELVTQFSLQSPAGIDQSGSGTAQLQAVSENRLYVRVRWDTPNGERSSIAALDRWTGAEQWQQMLSKPSEVAVIGDTEYVFDGGTLRAQRADGTVRWENDVAPFEYESQIDETATYMVPTDGALFVGTEEGVKEVDPDSGDVQRTLPGSFAAVGEDGLFTYGGQVPLAKFPLEGGTEPEWVARPSTGTGTGDTGAVANGTVFVSSPAGYENADDARIELFAYDAATGEEQWSVVASRTRQVGGFSALPGLSDLRVADGAVFFRSNRGLSFVDVASGELIEAGIPETLGAGEVVASRRLTYGFANQGSLDIASPAGTLLTPASADEPRPYRSVPVPERSDLDIRGGSALYGHGVLYLVSNGYIYGYSGTEQPRMQ
ncbi:outer membrane protein assembly factor BamB family protein [Haloarcula laminariae]|uniref:outer membrane protein assembly factor BamB family protein n=1 Tax=Haloarcula laminariae TaxID=2961577 RepID=UPI0024075747|nr:PQQ-binding-like beta-propeller repeat protein [Halomicroarcula sp. FL173]